MARRATTTKRRSEGATTYYLENIPPELSERVRARLGKEGLTLRWLLIQAMREYAAIVWTPNPYATVSESPTRR